NIPDFKNRVFEIALDTCAPLLHVRSSQIRIGHSKGGENILPEVVFKRARDLERGHRYIAQAGAHATDQTGARSDATQPLVVVRVVHDGFDGFIIDVAHAVRGT